MAKQIEVIRTLRAPIDMAWRVWVEPELVKRWWGPRHFTSPVAIMDFREGGRSLVSMQAPPEMGGQVYYSIWEYVRIVQHVSIEFIQSLADTDGQLIDPTTVGMPADFPRDVRTVVTFRALSATETEMTITEYAEFGSISHFAQLGLEQSMEKIAAIFS
ncbi:MAG: SRPBCC domain-containing protein [Bacteroidetes bacterium]|nr:SRPBCC domain-containing protein [Bacteroidota bacterium]